MAKGFIKIEFVENGLACTGSLHDVGFMEKAALVNGFFTALEIDLTDAEQVSALIGLAMLLGKHAKKIKVDSGTIQEALRRVKGDGESEE